MSLLVRRFAVVSVAALAVLAGGSAAATATASAQSAPTVSFPEPDGTGGANGYHGGRERPLHFGPFEFPRYGSVSGGFTWGLRD